MEARKKGRNAPLSTLTLGGTIFVFTSELQSRSQDTLQGNMIGGTSRRSRGTGNSFPVFILREIGDEMLQGPRGVPACTGATRFRCSATVRTCRIRTGYDGDAYIVVVKLTR